MKQQESFAQKSVYWMKVISLGLILGLGIQFAQAWTNPPAGIAPPGGNVSGGPITTSIANQVKVGGLGLGGSLLVLGATNVWDLQADSVNITHTVKVGNTTASCSSLNAGAIRWTGIAFEGCDGSGTWKPFGGGGGAPTPVPPPATNNSCAGGVDLRGDFYSHVNSCTQSPYTGLTNADLRSMFPLTWDWGNTTPTAHGAIVSVTAYTYYGGDTLWSTYTAVCQNGVYVFYACDLNWVPAPPIPGLG